MTHSSCNCWIISIGISWFLSQNSLNSCWKINKWAYVSIHIKSMYDINTPMHKIIVLLAVYYNVWKKFTCGFHWKDTKSLIILTFFEIFKNKVLARQYISHATVYDHFLWFLSKVVYFALSKMSFRYSPMQPTSEFFSDVIIDSQ